MSTEGIMRFFSVRPAKYNENQFTNNNRNFYLFPSGFKTSFYEILEDAKNRKVSKNEYISIAQNFKSTDGYVQDINELKFNIKLFLEYVNEHSSTELQLEKLKRKIEKLYGDVITEIVELQSFQETFISLADSILSDCIAIPTPPNRRDRLIIRFKLMKIISTMADNVQLPEVEKIGELLSQTTLILPDLTDLSDLPSKSNVIIKQLEPTDSEIEVDRIKKKLGLLTKVYNEIIHFLQLTEHTVTKTEADNSKSNVSHNDQKLWYKNKIHGRIDTTLPPIDLISVESKSVLHDLEINSSEVSPFYILELIETEMRNISSQLPSKYTPKKIIHIGSGIIDATQFQSILKKEGISKDLVAPSSCSFKAGIGDLLLVKQTLKAYELTEFAHVENILAGESKEREHRRHNLLEEIEITEEENETIKERDLQSTERNELQTEAERTINNQLKLETGLKISGSYGPSVNFTSSLNASSSTTVDEAQRQARSFGQDITIKSSERILNRVKKVRQRRILEEIEEINKHQIQNTGMGNAGNITGVYRWLNKIYDAQVLNYGQRMMYEFVVPEPATYYLHEIIQNPSEEDILIKPEPPTYPQTGGSNPLKPENLTQTNYQDYVSQYGITDAPVPPAQYIIVSFCEHQDRVQNGDPEAAYGRSSKLEIPEGYVAIAACIQKLGAWRDINTAAFVVIIGGRKFETVDELVSYKTFGRLYEKEISVVVQTIYLESFSIGIDVVCKRTSRMFEEWQQAMYKVIIETYQIQKKEYETKLEEATIQKGIKILGNNPLENRKIEREELKKTIIMMLTGKTSIALDSFEAGSPTEINIEAACKNGAYLQFFENAFEWNNLVYVFYPYYWGRESKWSSALHLKDPDPDFTAFLKAGAARVQVPVRPGYERAIAHFCQFNQIWEGNDIPLRDDDLYVPIVDEISENLGKFDVGIPYPEGAEPWKVTIPTSLVLLQDSGEVPDIEDSMSDTDNGLR
ncbi:MULTISPECIES: hypothetical protein [Bacillus]|uniref:hypothetical protein n=1 Tax=Bacillus TaxID=1386 RepID=UPI000BF69638|nr:MULTISPECIES: hypothetical protein [Bacillus]KAF6700429.1 hypothetical protein HFD78_09910 [Bacillus sp. EKM501B]PFS08394.1 hypothetical protein COK60_01550 [Bacillus thuringiensis]